MSSQALMAKVALPYAEALVELGQSSKTLHEMSKDVTIVRQILEESPSLTILFSNPLISQKAKEEVTKKLFSDQVHHNLLTFFLVLIKRKRIAYLGLILDKYLETVSELESRVIANIITAKDLSDSQKQALEDKLKSMTGREEIQLDIEVDSELIAGFIVQIGSKVIDTSLRGQLKNISYFLEVAKV